MAAIQMLDFKRTRISWNRSIFDYAKVQAVASSLMRNRRILLGRRRARYLNVGCGPNILRDFYNLDYSWRPGIDACWDICRGLPFEMGAFNGVFSEHCLEHISLSNFEVVVAEVLRVLVPGGTFRIVVPDAELYLRAYVAEIEGEGADIPYRDATVERTALMSVNRVFREHGHQYAWDFHTMKLVLESVGYVDVRRCRFREGRDPQLLVCNEERSRESLYLEAAKPKA